MPARKALNADLISGIVAVLFGIAYFILATVQLGSRTPFGTDTVQDVGFPRAMSIIIMLSGLIIVISSFIKLRKLKSPEDVKETKAVHTDKKKSILLWAALIAYIWGIKVVGYMVATPLYLFVALLLSNYKSLKKNLLIAIILPFVIYISFRYGLQIYFPRNIFSNLF